VSVVRRVAPPVASPTAARRVRDPAEFGKVCVLFGGRSAEREVSLQSGRAVLEGLRSGGVDAHPVDVGDDFFRVMETGRFDRAFNVLHGRGGEDGVIQGALRMLGVPCTGSGVLGSALAMDKQRTKLVWQSVDLPVAPSVTITAEDELEAASEQVGFPIMVKPVHEGSSIGTARADDGESLLSAWWLAAGYDREVMIERWIMGVEYTVAIVDREVLPPIRLETPREFYDYEAKYADGAGTRYICPCGLEGDALQGLESLALRAFDAVAASGWGRVDLIRDERGECWLLEVNTNPGMTSHSLVPMAARAAGMSFEQLVWRILETAS
jgi:D-alanine-D-alanine ligase